MEYITAVAETEYKSEFEPTKYIPYLTLTGELWYVFCKDFEENWLRYNGTTLYVQNLTIKYAATRPYMLFHSVHPKNYTQVSWFFAHYFMFGIGQFEHTETETKWRPFPNTFSWMKISLLIQISPEFVDKGPINNMLS